LADFVKLAATAKRLVDKNGRTATLIKQGNTPTDPTKPWRGLSTTPVASVTGKVCFVSPSDLGLVQENLDNVKRTEKVALFAANNDQGKLLEGFDLIRDGATDWKILRSELLQPATKKLLYMFEVAR